VTLPVSIVIPVYNGRELLEKLLESIARQSVAPLEVLVVDNGSTDGAPESATRAGARVIAMGRNSGFAAAVNQGIREAKGEAIALINSDVVLDTSWLGTLWKSLAEGPPEIGFDFSTGRILQLGSGNVLDGSFDLICRGGCSWRAGAGRNESILSDSPQTIQFCSATAAIYRASLFREIGLFDESYESYLEDVDFGLRCAAAGRKGNYDPDAVCWHRGSATFGRWTPRVVRLIARNQVFLLARHYPRQLIRRWLWAIVVAHALWGCLAVRHGCGFAWLRGKAEGLRKFSDLRRAEAADPATMIAESEREIHRLQSLSGFDAYWKFYFKLAGFAR
jgi:GT2 family glycosyltransferase